MIEILISCIVPVYNGERYLKPTLDSILTQTYRSLEVIVVDDGSTDSTAHIVESYGAQIRYVYQPNAGPAAARNLGLGLVHGEYVAFLDADDLWVPHKLQVQLARFEARSELEISLTHIRNFWSVGSNEIRFAEMWPAHNNTNALLARRYVFDKVGLFDNKFLVGEDIEWFIRAAQQGIIKELLPDVTVYHRLHGANISQRMEAKLRDEMLNIVQGLLMSRRAGNGK